MREIVSDYLDAELLASDDDALSTKDTLWFKNAVISKQAILLFLMNDDEFSELLSLSHLAEVKKSLFMKRKKLQRSCVKYQNRISICLSKAVEMYGLLDSTSIYARILSKKDYEIKCEENRRLQAAILSVMTENEFYELLSTVQYSVDKIHNLKKQRIELKNVIDKYGGIEKNLYE